MDFVKCLESVKKEYETYNENQLFFCVDYDAMITDTDYVFVAVKDFEGKAVICDYANNLQNFEVDVQVVKNICKNYNVIFDDYELKKIYNSNKDIENYVKCVVEISNILKQI